MPEAVRLALKAVQLQLEPQDGLYDNLAVGVNANMVAYYRIAGKLADKSDEVILISPDGKKVLAVDDSEYSPQDGKSVPVKPEWKPFAPPQGRCSITFPGVPEDSTKRNSTSVVHQFIKFVARSAATSEFNLMYMDLNAANQYYDKPAKEILAAFAELIYVGKNPNRNPQSKKDIQLNGYLGVEWVWEDETIKPKVASIRTDEAIKYFANNPQSFKSRTTARLILVDHRLYGATVYEYGVSDPKSSWKFDPESTRKFLDSFALLGSNPSDRPVAQTMASAPQTTTQFTVKQKQQLAQAESLVQQAEKLSANGNFKQAIPLREQALEIAGRLGRRLRLSNSYQRTNLTDRRGRQSRL